jgi:hypothetical protein
MPMTDTYGHMGIGTITPDKSAILDLFSTTAGFLMPRMTNAQRNALANPATGLMIFNTDTKTIEFNIGTTFAPIWDPVVTTSSGSGLYWQLLGNAGTNPAVNFIGTTDGQPLVVRTNSVERLRVATTGEVGIGTSAPTAGRMLEVAGAAGTANVRFGSASGAADGSAWTPGANDGFVTADANGDLLKRSAGAAVGAVAWLKTGNGGAFTDGTDNLLGTTSNAPLNVIVNGARAMRFEPNATSPNVIGGFNGNNVTSGAVGGVIGGGGASANLNRVTDNHGTIGGGINNQAGDNGGTVSDAAYATVGGGQNNTASEIYSTVAGGRNNTASDNSSTVGGGQGNTASAFISTVSGGFINTASGNASTVSGGSHNRAIGDGSTVSGGASNIDSGEYSTIAGGTGLTFTAAADRSFGFHANNSGGTRDMTISAPDVAVFGNADLWLANNDNNPSELRFFEAYNSAGAFPNTANYTAFKAATTQGNDITYTLPSTNGTAGQLLSIVAAPAPTATTATLEWASPTSNDWSLTGNSGTTPGTNFLGTIDNTAFEIKVFSSDPTANRGSKRVMRYEPNATSANIIGGYQGNSVTAGVVGATIAGGGANGAANSVTGDYGVVGGGQGNTASGTLSTVGGGNLNTASNDNATVGGGGDNTASGNFSTVGGGQSNMASEHYSTVGGGQSNMASGQHSTVGGGQSNTASWYSSTVSGGESNTASALSSTVGGGNFNSVSGDYSTVGGGQSDTASGYSSTVGGGYSNTASGQYSTVGGGQGNTASGTLSTVGGGNLNTASGYSSTVGGGQSDTAAGDHSAIPGGRGLTLTSTADRSFGFHSNNSTGNLPMTISTPNVAVFGNADLWLANNDGNSSELRFFEAFNMAGSFPSTANYTAFKAQTQTGDITYTLPAAAPAGAGNGVLTATAGGTMSWGSHRRVAAVAGTAQVITDAAISTTSTIIVTIKGTIAYGTVTAQAVGTFTFTTNVALTTADFINYVILP